MINFSFGTDLFLPKRPENVSNVQNVRQQVQQDRMAIIKGTVPIRMIFLGVEIADLARAEKF